MTPATHQASHDRTSAELLRRIGEKLYGSRWQTDLSNAIGVNDRSMRRWVSGEDRIPDGVWRDIRLHVESRWIDLRELDYQIKDSQKIAAYRFQRWNQAKGDFDISPIKATQDYINRVGCEITGASEQFVEPWEIDSDGRYVREKVEQQRSVSDVMSTTQGHGFHILDKNRAPQITFEYEDQETAIRMRRLVKEASGTAAQVTVHRR